MPVVINRSDTGGSGKKPDKGAAKSPKNTSAKGAAKASQAKGGGAGLSLQDQRVRIAGLSTIIVLALLFIAWWMGIFGGSEPAARYNNNTTVGGATVNTSGSPGVAVSPGAVPGTKGASMGLAPGGRVGGGFAPDDTGAAGTRGGTNANPGGNGIE